MQEADAGATEPQLYSSPAPMTVQPSHANLPSDPATSQGLLQADGAQPSAAAEDRSGRRSSGRSKKKAVAAPVKSVGKSAEAQPGVQATGSKRCSEPATAQRRRSGRFAKASEQDTLGGADPNVDEGACDECQSDHDQKSAPGKQQAQLIGRDLMLSGVVVDGEVSKTRSHLEIRLRAAGLESGLAGYYRCGGGFVDGRDQVAFQSLRTAAEYFSFDSVIEAERAHQTDSKVSCFACQHARLCGYLGVHKAVLAHASMSRLPIRGPGLLVTLADQR